MREQFTGSPPIRVTEGNREEIIATVTARIKTLNNIDVATNRYISEREKARFLTAFTSKDPSPDRYYYRSDEHFRLVTNDQNELTIANYYEETQVADLEEIFSFIAVCQERLNRQHALKTRRQKVRDLKAQAIIARIKTLAEEEKFDFATDTDTQKLKLFVRLDANECIELHVSFKDFEETLPKLRSAIVSLRELRDKGIRFKLRSTTKIGWRTQWVSHESLE